MAVCLSLLFQISPCGSEILKELVTRGVIRLGGRLREFRRPPLSLDDARRLVSGYVDHYNNVRLNSATGYVTPKDMLAGRQQEIHAERDRKLEMARKQRRIRRQQVA